MKEVTKTMIKNFQIYEKGIDFMGYHVNKKSPLSFHHMIVSHKTCRDMNLGDGYWYWNGAILVQDTSHDYLHTIERVDEDMFYAITSELIEQNAKGQLDTTNIRAIHDILNCFEREHCADRTNKGKVLIKEQYLRRAKI